MEEQKSAFDPANFFQNGGVLIENPIVQAQMAAAAAFQNSGNWKIVALDTEPRIEWRCTDIADVDSR